MNADNAALAGELTVPRDAKSLVIFVDGERGGAWSEPETDIADFLHRRGVGTLLIDLVPVDETLNRATRSDVGLFAERLRGVLAWIRNRETIASLDFGFFGADTSAAAVLEVLSTETTGATVTVLGNGRVDLSDGNLENVCLPLLFVVDRDYDHLHHCTRSVYASVGTNSEEKNLLWSERGADFVYGTAGWFESYLSTPRYAASGQPG